MNNMMKNSNNLQYTHQLPYRTRDAICKLLDADYSWKTLGGQLIGLNATQLSLTGQAYLRPNGSPTEELLNRLDSANVFIIELFNYFERVNNQRAIELLKPFVINRNNKQAINSSSYNIKSRDDSGESTSMCPGTLDTPTPSFTEQPAIMFYNNQAIENPLPWTSIPPDQPGTVRAEPPQNCHRQAVPPTNMYNNNNYNQQQQQPAGQQQPVDPGEEIVRLACTKNSKRTSITDEDVVNQLRLIMHINYNELKLASNDFSRHNILGNGGFALVYRGNWKGTDVAIKRLKCNLMDQALNELTILNSYRIDNILPIYGISIDGPEACLVYQFMANGSLEDQLSCKKGNSPLTWIQRANISEGVAKGLYYLHTLRDKPLIHGDVKSANVLLDSQFVPKLGDFGLARQMFKGKNSPTELSTHCTVSSIHGTSVYLPPEYLRQKILSPAVDVYSYGTVLLEMATGRRAYDGKKLLVELVEEETRALSRGQIGYNLKDPRLADERKDDAPVWYDLLVYLGLNCTNRMKRKRPDMGQILSKMTEFKSVVQQGDDVTFYHDGYKNFILNPLSSATTNGTTGTLTPECSTLDRQQQKEHPQSVQPEAAPPVHPIDQRNHEQLTNNWVLMSVEEESDLKKYANLIYPQESQQVLVPPELVAISKSKPSVEDMIPLITELGLEAQQQEQQQQQ